MAQDVRLACVGLGWFGNVLAAAATASGAEIAGGFARSEQSRNDFVAKHGGRAYSSYDEILQDPAVDGVLLATPHSAHADQIVAAAEANKHVFVEKPFALNVESAKRALAASVTAGTVLQVGHNQRRQPANRRLKQLIDSGDLGTVTMIETHQSIPKALAFEPDYWRANHDESPLGGMTSLGVHMIDTMMYLLGPIDRVFTFSREILDAPFIDHATTIVFEFESGPLGYLGTSFVVPRANSVAVRGTAGTAINDENGAKFYLQSPDDTALRPEPIDVLDTVADEITEYVAAVRGDAVPETGGAEGLRVITVLEAAAASRNSGGAEYIKDYA
ncbi:MAG: Gfo/Idh/MocA family protein [Acidimicrobiia bacterium]